MTTHVTVTGYETIHAFEGEAAAQEYAAWAYRVGYSPIVKQVANLSHRERIAYESYRQYSSDAVLMSASEFTRADLGQW